jgi:hypothetical protein
MGYSGKAMSSMSFNGSMMHQTINSLKFPTPALLGCYRDMLQLSETLFSRSSDRGRATQSERRKKWHYLCRGWRTIALGKQGMALLGAQW